MKFLIAILGLTSAYAADQVSLLSLLQKNKVASTLPEKQILPENCLKTDEINGCVQCSEGYEIDSGRCFKVG